MKLGAQTADLSGEEGEVIKSVTVAHQVLGCPGEKEALMWLFPPSFPLFPPFLLLSSLQGVEEPPSPSSIHSTTPNLTAPLQFYLIRFTS